MIYLFTKLVMLNAGGAYFEALNAIREDHSVFTGFEPLFYDDDGEKLGIDWSYISSLNNMIPTKLIILVSGIHGIEGYVGSALQVYLIDNMLNDFNLHDTGILIIHGANPFGFKHRRRVTKDNIDLNRNFVADIEDLFIENDIYSELNEKLNPAGPVTKHQNIGLVKSLLPAIPEYGIENIKEALLIGQYDHPDGLWYGGGKDGEFSIEKLAVDKIIFENIECFDLNSFEEIMFIDIHSGYGEKSKINIFAPPLNDDDQKTKFMLDKIFSDFSVEYQDEGLYEINGDFMIYFYNKLYKEYPDIVLAPVTFEIGTLKNNYPLFTDIFSLVTVSLENQGYHNGYYEDDDGKIQEDVSYRMRTL